MQSEIKPYKNQALGKKAQVAEMFNNISPKYDFLNHLLSLGIDVSWRKKAIRLLKENRPTKILDVATGTADFAIQAASLSPEKIIGVDISEGMLEIGRIKIKQKKLDHLITLETGDSEQLNFQDNHFDAVIVAFGVRNFENLESGLANMQRVLKKDGKVIILEFSKPTSFPFREIYYFYFKYVLPIIGRLVSKDTSAYTYLPESVNAFPQGDSFLRILEKTGFKSTQCIPLTFGICSIYTGLK
ncbi:MAG: bifunctional demethylmenaquinone methyltransferase/2-methoxy-6-polyprenyl-1,4-benzoquinol methylase UbiE [Cyclobacteriaceae bacterium]|nr:bifunctional demethylmenaquinone methyltransferase/2-methoxy-6-polyprenyl-1,4-benzoquinol methylase UbiE [Cyclobacteriaceae bacterium]